MNYIAQIKIMPLKDLLDPQGKAIMGGLQTLGISEIEDVRIGKHIEMKINCSSEDEAAGIATDATKKLLANQVMETFEVKISEAK